MIIHKNIDDKKPHEGLEYRCRSKEPENYAECANLWCWECVYYGNITSFLDCKHRDKLKAKWNNG